MPFRQIDHPVVNIYKRKKEREKELTQTDRETDRQTASTAVVRYVGTSGEEKEQVRHDVFSTSSTSRRSKEKV